MTNIAQKISESVPSRLFLELPKTPNAKIDRQALLERSEAK